MMPGPQPWERATGKLPPPPKLSKTRLVVRYNNTSYNLPPPENTSWLRTWVKLQTALPLIDSSTAQIPPGFVFIIVTSQWERARENNERRVKRIVASAKRNLFKHVVTSQTEQKVDCCVTYWEQRDYVRLAFSQEWIERITNDFSVQRDGVTLRCAAHQTLPQQLTRSGSNNLSTDKGNFTQSGTDLAEKPKRKFIKRNRA